MKKHPIFIFLVCFTCFFVIIESCQSGKKRSADITVAITDTIAQITAPSTLYFDSAALPLFLQQYPLLDTFRQAYLDFYARRQYQFVWYSRQGLSETAFGLAAHTAQIFDKKGISLPYSKVLDSLLHPDDVEITFEDTAHLLKEFLLTGMYFHYAQKILQGIDEGVSIKMGWLLPRRKTDITQLLDSFLVAKDWDTFEKNTLNEQYFHLRKALQHYKNLAAGKERLPIPRLSTNTRRLRTGDSADAVPLLAARLYALGFTNITFADTIHISPAWHDAIRKARAAYGLNADSSIDNALIDALNVPAAQRIETILVNMERFRWIPAQIEAGQLLFVNIPDFRLIFFTKGQPSWQCRVVVGTPVHKTVVFSGLMDYVVFSPYWYVPQSIIRNEIGLSRARSAAYLRRKNMEWVGGSLREKPGPNNSLGQVKFIFPNSNSIYLHDTPAKDLFNRENRAFSHGCIRVGEPFELAKRILASDTAWTDASIKAAMQAGKEKKVVLKEKIPVYIGYFTAFADSTGMVHFRNDIYKRDALLLQALTR